MEETGKRQFSSHFNTANNEAEAVNICNYIDECASRSAEALLANDLESAEYWHLVARNCKSRIFASAA